MMQYETVQLWNKRLIKEYDKGRHGPDCPNDTNRLKKKKKR